MLKYMIVGARHMKSILEKYLDKEVGINIENAFHFEPAVVTAVEADHFTVVDTRQSYTHHFSYGCIVQIIESEGGVDVGGFMSHKHFNVAIKVGHIMPVVGPGY